MTRCIAHARNGRISTSSLKSDVTIKSGGARAPPRYMAPAPLDKT